MKKIITAIAAGLLLVGSLVLSLQAAPAADLQLNFISNPPSGTEMQPGEMVTFTVQLQQNGGTEPALAALTGTLPAGLNLVGPVDVLTNKALPNRARIRDGQILWQGQIAPDGQLLLRYRALVGYQQEPAVPDRPDGGQTWAPEATSYHFGPLTATVRLRGLAGPLETMSIGVIAGHGPFELNKVSAAIGVQSGGALLQQSDILADQTAQTLQLSAQNTNTETARVMFLLLPPVGTELAADSPAVQSDAGAVEATAVRRFLLEVQPGETITNTVALKINRTLEDGEQLAVQAKYCVLDPGAFRCPELESERNETLPPIVLTAKRRDLGDAPDSSNHFAAPMSAYPGVPAAFPTVFDPATGLPQGPMHVNPRPFHLGLRVSPELEADLGPDGDPSNNIVPPLNGADRDRFDDGVALNQIQFNHCQPASIPVRLFISPRALDYFTEIDEDKLAFLNVYLDSNRDGDWADVGSCPNPQGGGNLPAAEHIVVDAPIDVTALGAGVHDLTITAPLPLWPSGLVDRPAWLRVTLSERESNKTLAGGQFGDGRGYALPFRTGETEDYLYRGEAAADWGADVWVDADWQPRGDERRPAAGDVRGAAASENPVNEMVVRFANRGTAPAKGVEVSVELAGGATIVDATCLIRDPRGGEAPCQIAEADGAQAGLAPNRRTFRIESLNPFRGGAITLGWVGCLTCTRPTLAPQHLISVVANEDVDLTNNLYTVTVSPVLRAPLATIWTGDEFGPYLNEAVLAVRGRPGETVAVYANGVATGDQLALVDDKWVPLTYPVTAAPVVYSLVVVDGGETGPSSQPLTIGCRNGIVPASVTLTNGAGNAQRPDSGAGLKLRPGQSYGVRVLGCGSPLPDEISFTLGNQTIDLADGDGNGIYTSTLVIPAADIQQAAALPQTALLEVRSGQTVYETAYAVGEPAGGRVSDGLTGDPLAGASVTILAAQEAVYGEASRELFVTWTGAPNPLTTAGDGRFEALVPNGRYQLRVDLAGYQPYRSGTIEVTDGEILLEVPLMPLVSEPADHVVDIEDAGFGPAVLTVRPGEVIAFRNVGSGDHGANGGAWSSGLLAPGESFLLAAPAGPGSYPYADPGSPGQEGLLVVDPNRALFLPLITR